MSTAELGKGAAYQFAIDKVNGGMARQDGWAVVIGFGVAAVAGFLLATGLDAKFGKNAKKEDAE